jgi:hypothetical protein
MQTNYKIEYTSKGETFEEVFVIPTSIELTADSDFFKEQICSRITNDMSMGFMNDEPQECDVVILKIETF